MQHNRITLIATLSYILSGTPATPKTLVGLEDTKARLRTLDGLVDRGLLDNYSRKLEQERLISKIAPTKVESILNPNPYVVRKILNYLDSELIGFYGEEEVNKLEVMLNGLRSIDGLNTIQSDLYSLIEYAQEKDKLFDL